MADRVQGVEAIFMAALELEGKPAREAYVESACRGQPEVYARVIELLQAHDASHGPLDVPPTDMCAPDHCAFAAY